MSAPHPFITAYLDHLRAAGKGSTATTYSSFLRGFQSWMEGAGHDLATATPDTLTAYQIWIARTYRTGREKPLAITTQATCILIVKAFYGWLHRRGFLLSNPAARLVPADPPETLTVRKDHLDMQEATALVATAATLVEEQRPATVPWAIASRNLAAISLALATGRRVQGLCDLLVSDLDTERCELRVAYEKGKAGRVLPVAGWAVAAARRYLTDARSILLGDRTSDHLLVSQRADRLTERAVTFLLAAVVAETIRRNPDLIELPGKRISTHSLRVTFAATLMFANGCGIRSLNEMMLHANLNTTARYTPIPVEDLRRNLNRFHPRA
jgi:site-specific recombinase XerD